MKSLTQLAVFILAVLLCTISLTTASIFTKNNPKTLIFYTQSDFKTQYSTLLTTLESCGHILTVINPIDDVVSLKNYDKLLYDNVLIFSSQLGDAIPSFPHTNDFLDFVENGGSLFVAPTDGILSQSLRNIGLAYGIEYMPSTAVTLDTANPQSPFFQFPLPNIDSKILGTVANKGLHMTKEPRSFTLAGTPMMVVDNKYTKKVISGTSTMLSIDHSTNHIFESGDQLSFITALQLKNNARMLFFPDTIALSNQFLSLPNSANHKLTNTICWVTHDCGHVRIKTFNHNMFRPTEEAFAVNRFLFSGALPLYIDYPAEKYTEINPKSYKKGEHLHFDVVLEEYNGETKEWQNTVSNDVIFDMTQLHSYITFPIEFSSTASKMARNNSLLTNEGDRASNMSFEVTVPDFQGVYRTSLSTGPTFASPLSSGVSFLKTEESPIFVHVRPPNHNEWRRFMFIGYPYYLSMFILMGCFFVFSVAFLYTK